MLRSVLVVYCILIKRLREPVDERRPWKIWFFDTSKQAFGAGMVHLANIFLADFKFFNMGGDPCTLYLVNFLLDSSLGLIFIYILVKLSQCIIKWRGYKTLLSGEYGDPPKLEAWIGQCALYLLILLISKILIILVILLEIWDKMHSLFNHKYLLSGGIRIVLHVLIIPFIVNGIMFWIVDNILMKHKRNKKKKRGLPMYDVVKYHKGNSDSESDVLLTDREDNDRVSSSDEKIVSEQLLHRSV
ncbi:store-operated calcium entry regulator STIMATE-like isoform X2 [Anneissia japonica]|uniref:store-operated calcium entry regulator STIMATE-like isoform X2 n=1 Tax=Anneissia japonica TaxID=1529436 RepID=UPI001425818F|nr:store-operated calcium entry regulator STIMATE-like isoform X2 [Anneissia japonica]